MPEKCSSCIHKDASAAWIHHGDLLYGDFEYSVEKVKVEMDAATKEWFRNRPAWEVTTVQKCEKCGLFYKPELGHKCEKEVK